MCAVLLRVALWFNESGGLRIVYKVAFVGTKNNNHLPFFLDSFFNLILCNVICPSCILVGKTVAINTARSFVSVCKNTFPSRHFAYARAAQMVRHRAKVCAVFEKEEPPGTRRPVCWGDAVLGIATRHLNSVCG